MAEKSQSQSPRKKSETASKSVFLCAYLHAGVQSVVRAFPVEAVNPDLEWPPSFFPQKLQKHEGSFPVTSLTALQQFRKLPSAVAVLVSSGFVKWSDCFSQQFYLPLLARPLLILWHYYHVVLVICFAT